MRDSPRTPSVEGVLRDLADRMAKIERRLGTEAASTVDAGVPDYQALGDLRVGTGYDESTRLPVGDDLALLVADSAEPSGLRWGPRVIVSQTEPADPVEGDIWLALP